MSKISITPNASGTGVFTISSPATSTNRTLTLPDEAGTVLTSASSIPTSVLTGNIIQNAGPAFSAYQSSAQTLSSNTATKIQFQTKLFDTNNNFDNATNYRFTPTVAGYYQVNAAIQAQTSFTGGTIYLYKNGSSQFATGMAVVSGGGTFVLSHLVQMNGTTDYLEVYGNIGTGQALAVATFFQASMVRAA
jgi:hypothetical protein